MSNNPHPNHQIQQNMQMGSGLTRYRSAPSSYFATLLSSPTTDGGGFGADDFEQLFNPRASSPETQRIFSTFMNSNSTTDAIPENCTANLPPPAPLLPQSQMNCQLLPPSKAEPEVRQSQSRPPLQRQQSNDYSSAAKMIFPAHSVPQENSYEKPEVPPPARPPLQRQQSNDYSSAAKMIFPAHSVPQENSYEKPEVPPPARPPLQRQQSNDYSSAAQMMYQSHNGSQENSYDKLWGSFKSNRVDQMKMESGAGGNSGLIRHSSSPAGLFADINIEAFLPLRGIGSFGAGNSAKTEAYFSSSASRFKTEMNSSSSIIDPQSEMGNKAVGENDHHFSWDDSMMLPDNFLKDLADSESPRFSNSSDDQIKGGGKRPAGLLSHHLSLPKNVTDLSAVEKLLQDSVPCKIRAKRGFATHPRSIAERVRRTKISDRMRKLQEFVPNMEKQTNTSDMLDLAVDYIKDLQKQVKTLSDNQAKCTCLAKQGS